MAAITLNPPPARGALVRRPRLVGPLCELDAPPLTMIVAPAGYGKTTVLREWAKRDARPFAWLVLDERDNDPGRLLGAITSAVDAVSPAGSETPFVLVLDDAHVLGSAAVGHVLAGLASDLPAGSAVAFAARREPPLPVARLRAQRAIAELGPRELALTRPEAMALFRLSGLDVDTTCADVLLRRTEGWPVGLSLAALCLGDCPSAAAVARFGGHDRVVADYIRDEVLAGLPDAHVRFLRRTSILDTLHGPQCDAVLERTRSAAMLADLATGGALLVPLDRSGERYRHHRLLADALYAELRRTEPEREGDLHRRAAAWHREAGDLDRALRHTLSAGDLEAAAALVTGQAGHCIANGREDVLERRLQSFSESQLTADPGLCLAAAGHHLTRGEGHLVEHWAALAGDGVPEGVTLVLRAALGRDGIARMADDAATASAQLDDRSPWRAVCALLSGVAAQLGGARELAVPELEDGARRAAVRAPNVHALCLTQLAVLALERGDWEEAAELSTRARAQVDRHGLADDATMAIVFAVSAVVRGHRWRIDDARADAAQAARLRAQLTDFAPWFELELDVMLARSALRLSDVNAARDALAHAARLLRHVTGAPIAEQWVRDAEAQLEVAAGGGEAPQLTPAELRILRFLPTHLSFREIAEQTFVSANTVKTQAGTAYRKLDVSSRSEAVARATALGLL
jgi:LuxR family transcriptional regulator, maltose regulon positive regulatory protein